jgi:hypothetical protein
MENDPLEHVNTKDKPPHASIVASLFGRLARVDKENSRRARAINQ